MELGKYGFMGFFSKKTVFVMSSNNANIFRTSLEWKSIPFEPGTIKQPSLAHIEKDFLHLQPLKESSLLNYIFKTHHYSSLTKYS